MSRNVKDDVVDTRLAKLFGVELRKLRLARSLSQEDLAFEAGLDRTFVSMLERGVRQPTIETVFRIAKGLKIKASTIIRSIE